MGPPFPRRPLVSSNGLLADAVSLSVHAAALALAFRVHPASVRPPRTGVTAHPLAESRPPRVLEPEPPPVEPELAPELIPEPPSSPTVARPALSTPPPLRRAPRDPAWGHGVSPLDWGGTGQLGVGDGGDARLLDGIGVATLGTIEGGGWVDLEPLREALREVSACTARDEAHDSGGAALRVFLVVGADGVVLDVRAPDAPCVERGLRGLRLAAPSGRARLTVTLARTPSTAPLCATGGRTCRGM
jgi:hypothetical protein